MEEVIKKKKKGRPKTIYRKVGRKPMLTPEVLIEVEEYVKQGYSNQDVCAVLDINETTFYNWINRAQEIEEDETQLAKSENEIYLQFVKVLKRAKAEYKNTLKSRIEKHGYKQWQANAWLLERMFPDEFGKAPQEITFDDKTNKAVEQTLDLLRARKIEDADSNE